MGKGNIVQGHDLDVSHHQRTTAKGSYLLIFSLGAPLRRLTIGRFGSFDFLEGYYLYVGSAMGSGGLTARLAYHQLQRKRQPHWHIDYLRPHLRLVETWTVASELRLECLWCRALNQLPLLSVPVRGFGSRDTAAPRTSSMPTNALACAT
jgi:Uri superfamily endonuclease